MYFAQCCDKMKRAFNELSKEESENHSFDLSRVLKGGPQVKEHQNECTKNGKALPSFESFAFQPKNGKRLPVSLTEALSSEDDDFELGRRKTIKHKHKAVLSPPKPQSLEDNDFELTENKLNINNRSRRLVVLDDSDDDFNEENSAGNVSRLEVIEVAPSASYDSEGNTIDDIVGNALQKCDKISASLRRELYGTTSVPSTSSEGYSEVEDCAAKIVTQADISAACAADDASFQPILKPYQLVGVNFLLLLYRNNIGGAILADEMGLGKTIQAITYLTLLNHLDNDPGPHLIVCPASVLENWERGLQRWCPSFSVVQFHGVTRAAYAKELHTLAKAGLPAPFNVLLVCYSLFERHSAQQKDDRKLLKRWKWSCVIMDEAHALKDRNSYRRKNLMAVAKNANQRLMLTGTPPQMIFMSCGPCLNS